MRQSNRGVLGAIAGVVAATAAVVAAAAKAVTAAIGVAAIQPKTGCTLKIRYYIHLYIPPTPRLQDLLAFPRTLLLAPPSSQLLCSPLGEWLIRFVSKTCCARARTFLSAVLRRSVSSCSARSELVIIARFAAQRRVVGCALPECSERSRSARTMRDSASAKCSVLYNASAERSRSPASLY